VKPVELLEVAEIREMFRDVLELEKWV